MIMAKQKDYDLVLSKRPMGNELISISKNKVVELKEQFKKTFFEIGEIRKILADAESKCKVDKEKKKGIYEKLSSIEMILDKMEKVVLPQELIVKLFGSNNW